MRTLLIILFSLFSIHSFAVDIDKKTATALEYIRLGYVQHGFEELRKAAATNDLAAQFYVAVCYEHGIGVEKSEADAFKMYRKAAERGLPDAMCHIAAFYKDGIAVSQDSSREKEWLQRYSQKGGQLLLPDIIPIYNEGSQAAQGSGNVDTPRPVIVQAKPITVNVPQSQTASQPVAQVKKADVDVNIPAGKQTRLHTFALIIANENYMEVANVPNALNDGKVFAEYCQKTLGIPESNIRYVADATLNKMRRQFNWISQVIEAYKGDANVIFYYAGHGIPDESNKTSYLLPVDGYGSDVSTGYSLDKIYEELTTKKAKSVVVFLDACFSGTNRDGDMLASARGVAIKARQSEPKGNMVVLSAAQGDETAYPYKEKGHGMFTYYLLKKLRDTRGDIAFGDLADYVTSEVMKQSVVINGKMQTPQASASSDAKDWRNWKFK